MSIAFNGTAVIYIPQGWIPPGGSILFNFRRPNGNTAPFVYSQTHGAGTRVATTLGQGGGAPALAVRDDNYGTSSVILGALDSTTNIARWLINNFEGPLAYSGFYGSATEYDLASGANPDTANANCFTLGGLGYIDGTGTFQHGVEFTGELAEAWVFNRKLVAQDYTDVASGAKLPEQLAGVVDGLYATDKNNLTTINGVTFIVSGTPTGLTNGTQHPVTRTVADTTPPTVIAAAVANGTPTKVALTMSEAMDTASVPAASAFTVAGHTVSAVAIVGNVMTLTVTPAFVNGEAARVAAYVQPATNKARDLATTPNPLASFSNYSITNNVAAAGDTTPPSLSTAQVLNSAPSQMVLTFSETLGAVTPAAAAFAVSGGKTILGVARNGSQITLSFNTAYAYGDNITVTYTKPGTNPIQDPSGNQANSFGPSAVGNAIANPGVITTFTPTKQLTARADRSVAASVAVHAFVHDKLTGALVGTKTGLVTSSTGIPPAFTGNYGVSGTEYDVKFVDDANPRRRSLELITAS